MARRLQHRLVAGIAAAVALGGSLAAITPPSVKFTDTTLQNGLRLIVAEDHVAPVFSVAVVYNVGSRNERTGRTGFAHLFEHMMFKGSENVGPGEHFYTIFSHGGTMNGTTSKERTLYYETMPANQLDAAMFLEADRMRSLAIVKENLDNQRNAVQEERRQGLDNQPYGRTNESVDDLAFDNAAYKHSVIGSMDDLNAAATEDVAAFFQTYYAPNNAILAVTGDVMTARVRELARKYFEPIPKQPAPPDVDVNQPPQSGERRLSLEDPLARLPRLDISYRIPSNLSPDDDSIDVLSRVLAGGRSSRFFENIVRQKQLAVNAGAFAPDSRGPRLFRIVATPTPGKSLEDLEAAIYAEIEQVKAKPIADWELDKARNAARRQFVGDLAQSLPRAINLAEYALIYNDPGLINTRWDRIAKLNIADVQRVAKQYLTADNRSVIVTRPKAGPKRRVLMHPRRPFVALALVAGSLSVAAQQPPMPNQPSPTQGVVKKGKVPVSSEILKVKLPKAVDVDLPNGLHLMVLEDHRLPQISFQLFIPGAGGYYDPAEQPGLATFVAALAREGTASRTSDQISQQLEVMAASLTVSAGTGLEATVTGSSLTDQFDALLDIAADVLLHPSFSEEELGRYKQRMRAQLTQQRSNPGFLAAELFNRVMYGAHPASRLSPTAAVLDATTRDSLAAFHRARYVPDHAGMAIAGDISPADVRKLVEARLGAWAKSGAPAPAVSDPVELTAPKIAFIGRPSSVQTNLIVGAQAIARTHPDYDVLQVMNKVIGGGPTGRLFIHLREEKGYTYGAGSSLSAPMFRGDWSASTSVRSEVTEPALHDLLAEIAQLRDQAVSDQELADAKRSMIASFALSLESPMQLLNYHVTRWRYRLAVDYWDKYPDRLSAVTAQQVQAAARKYLDAQRLQIVAVGDPTRVADALKKLGPIEAFDVDGKRITSSF